MTHECVILFTYNSAVPRDVLAQNFDHVRRFNPDVPVVPLIHDGEPLLPGTVDVRRFDSPWDTADKWRSCDTILYRWFMNRTVTARRYVVLEWDMYATVSVAEFYAGVWDADISGGHAYRFRDGPAWYWFREIDRLGALAPYAAAIGPMAGILASHEALDAVCAGPILRDVFCELRLGTLANHAGCEMVALDPANEFIGWHPSLIKLGAAPGIYHPIKHVVDPLAEAGGAGIDDPTAS